MTTFGSIVLAAYRPDPDLFVRQLTSISDQTHSDFECLIVADGGLPGVAKLVERAVGSDPRFRVIGFEDRLGFYRNFERGLRSIDSASRWVALSDQDDYWYPEKLEVLLPFLVDHALVSGQARLVAHPSGEVIAENTNRRNTTPRETVIDNQFTGSFLVFRHELLRMAVPFPHVRTRAEAHDHWLAVCASVAGGALVIDRVLQDYVQHDRNVLGESRLNVQAFRPMRLLRQLLNDCRKYEGSAGPRSLLRYRYRQVLGWDSTIVTILGHRAPDSLIAASLLEVFGRNRRFRKTISFLARATQSRSIALGTALMFIQGWACEPIATIPRHDREPDDADRQRLTKPGVPSA